MGIATGMIIICHSVGFGCYCPNALLDTIIRHGSLGVDMFLFLSGLGCWYSITISKKSTGRGKLPYLQWIKKRFLRIFVPYAICFFVLQGIKGILYGQFDVLGELYLFSTIDYWVHHKGFWYIALLAPLYLLAPSLYNLLNIKANRLVLGSVVILILLVLTSINFEGLEDGLYHLIDNTQSAFKRATNFVLGMTIAPMCMEKRRINTWRTIGFFGALFVFQVLLRHYLGFYLFCNWCLTPILLIFFILLLNKIKVTSRLYIFITWLGVVSLESYITNGSTQGIATYIASCFPNSPWFYGHYLEYSIVAILGLASAYVFHKWSEKLLNVIWPNNKNNFTIQS